MSAHVVSFDNLGDIRHMLARDGVKAVENGWWGRGGGRRFFRKAKTFIPIIPSKTFIPILTPGKERKIWRPCDQR